MFTGWALGALAAAAALFATTAARHRRHAARTNLRLCRGCGNPQAPAAWYCRRCGRGSSE